MFILKHLKTLQHVSILFRSCSLLKLLILKFVKNVKVDVVMRQLNIWCVRAFCVKMYAHIFTQNARTHTKCYAAASPHRLLHF